MIEFKNVSKKFTNNIALDGLSLDLPEGKIIGLFGPNGAGKSTMLKMITGLNFPDSGEVLVDGNAPRKSRANIAYLPEIDHLYLRWTLKEAVNFTRTFYSDWDEVRYQDLLSFLQLDESMKIGKISKGQRAKCKLILTLSRKAPYLLMDEPFSGLDLLSRDEIADALIRDYSEGEQNIIISTHEIDEIENLVDHVIFINQGRIKLTGDAEELRMEKGMSLVEIMKEEFRHAKQ